MSRFNSEFASAFFTLLHIQSTCRKVSRATACCAPQIDRLFCKNQSFGNPFLVHQHLHEIIEDNVRIRAILCSPPVRDFC
ncbi:MAG: hypothetical protein WC053_02840 [Sideroxydans sp.]|jgi:hypothetical protein